MPVPDPTIHGTDALTPQELSPYYGTTLSALCSLLPRPLIMTGFSGTG